MKMRLALSLCLCGLAWPGRASLESGRASFEARLWPEAMADFLKVLEQDPSNSEAHAYVTLAARHIETDREAALRQKRLDLLSHTMALQEPSREDAQLLSIAVKETSEEGIHHRHEKWRVHCEEARVERQAGHLLSSYDLLLQVLLEDPSFNDAQRELSEVLAVTVKVLDDPGGVSILQRFALEGFRAFVQHDDTAALLAWKKLRAVIDQGNTPAEQDRLLKELRLLPYEKIAQRRAEETARALALRALLGTGVDHFQKQRYVRALEVFRSLAIEDPEYPGLGRYLTQAEAAVEKERRQRLGEKRQRHLDQAMQTGMAALEKQQYDVACASLERALRIDPTHAEARAYLSLATTEMKRLHDPRAAQWHYEMGLVAYASGKLDEAHRQWRTTLRMNPMHEKARLAMTKVEKELAYHSDTEPDDEAIP